MGVRSTGAKEKGYIKNLSTGEVKNFLFNPTTFTESISVTYNTVNGVGGAYPIVDFSSGSPNSIPLEIYLKGTPAEVRNWIKWLKTFVPKKSKKTKFAPPPMLKFALGTYSANCVVVSLSTVYSEFDTKLRPIEATVSVSLMEVVV